MGRKTYGVGKNIPATDKYDNKLDGSPNSNLDIYNSETGEIVSRKKYGPDGKAKKDLDFIHRDKKDKHVHDYNGTSRSERRSPNKKESREMYKAEKKRRRYNDRKR